ncbi:hypothetical protein HPB50_017601 [Hyalomma asiaticum]|uniref:Uncharacterized protein n=1 Tax=Hyalomma asiaticum TaxID=266040 RepID=A0ACB7TJX7_HYAAI|nr:hypothetical protein HPB50_017601 [Hyalomma asiaticum]
MGIVFSREELLKAQQNDSVCLGLSEGLREAERRDAAGSAADVEGGLEPACVAESPTDSYLLDHDGLLLKYTATVADAGVGLEQRVSLNPPCGFVLLGHGELLLKCELP